MAKPTDVAQFPVRGDVNAVSAEVRPCSCVLSLRPELLCTSLVLAVLELHTEAARESLWFLLLTVLSARSIQNGAQTGISSAEQAPAAVGLWKVAALALVHASTVSHTLFRPWTMQVQLRTPGCTVFEYQMWGVLLLGKIYPHHEFLPDTEPSTELTELCKG